MIATGERSRDLWGVGNIFLTHYSTTGAAAIPGTSCPKINRCGGGGDDAHTDDGVSISSVTLRDQDIGNHRGDSWHSNANRRHLWTPWWRARWISERRRSQKNPGTPSCEPEESGITGGPTESGNTSWRTSRIEESRLRRQQNKTT